MIMVVDTYEATKDITIFSEELKQIGEELGVVIQAQNEKIFNVMHRI